jgi:putative ABC transport system permease protein
LNYREYLAIREQTPSLERAGLWLSQSVNLTGNAEPERIIGVFATGSVFDVLGLVPEHGRFYSDEEAEPGRSRPLVVLTHAFWQRRFGGSESVLDQSITLNGTAFTVVGVVRPPFDPSTVPGDGGILNCDVFIPVGAFPGRNDVGSPGPSLLGIARLKPGVGLGTLSSDLRVVSARLSAEFPDTEHDRTARAESLQETVVGSSRTSLLLLLAAVGAVLLIACVNVSNLLLVRAVDRQREVALRVALGAGRSAIVRQLAVESSLLTVAAAIAGVAIGQWLLGGLIAFVRSSVPIPGRIPIDGTMLVFTVALTTIVAFVCAVAPALRVAGFDTPGALQAISRRATPGGRHVREGLVVTELALSLALLALSGLLVRSLVAVQRAPLGFDPGHVVTLQFRLPPAKYAGREQIAQFFEDAIKAVRAVPGVESAALVRAVPLSGNGGDTAVAVEGRTDVKGREPQARYHLITPDYFKTMRIALLRGRDFTDHDTLQAPAVAVVNQTLARDFWNGGDALGKRLRTPDMPEWLTVVGVVDDAKHASPTERPRPQLYVSHFQNPQIFTSLVARTSQPPMAVADAVRGAIWSVDKDQPLWAVMPLAAIVDAARGPWRFLAILLTLFAVVAVVIASVGVYGVMSYTVSQRTQEMGIRLALGASGSQLRLAVITRVLTLAGVGVVAGLGLAVAAARIASSVLVDVTPTDGVSLGGASAVLATVALAAGYVPARRASRIDPMTALRTD